MKRIVLLLALFGYLAGFGQNDSIRLSRLDSLSAEELFLYYQNEPEPIQFYKGPSTGDSLYTELLPMSVPTETVEGEPLLFRKHYPVQDESAEVHIPDSLLNIDLRERPKISIGAGSMAYHGDLYTKGNRMKSPLTGKPAFDLSISQRLSRSLQFNFSFLVGTVGANEYLNGRQENFLSEIRAGGISLLYDFGNYIPDRYKVRPFVSIGIYGFEFLSKTDIRDVNGNYYHYWSDGSIRNMAEGAPGAQNASLIVRDYRFESDVRELNKDGFGKYEERAWSMPLGFGVSMKLTDRFDLRFGYQYFFSSTDYIDGITASSPGVRQGTRGKDNFSYTSLTIQYDLITRKRARNGADTLSDAYWLALDNHDGDNDGVPDLKDNCLGTDAEAKVSLDGCPLDEDGDGVPNHKDDELNTAAGAPVSPRGVTQDDAYIKAWYDQFLNDSTDLKPEVVETENVLAPKKKKEPKKSGKTDDIYTVELVRYSGSIPTDELAFLLSIGDINSTTLPDGTTVVYTSGTYDMLQMAVKRRNEFRSSGHKSAGVSKIVGKDIIQIPDDEVDRLLNNEIEGSDGMTADSSGTFGGFGKDDVVYRVQLGAFKNKISTNIFNTSAGGVLELKTGENIFRYVTKGYRTIEEAAGVRADLVLQGYNDAFVTAYKSGKRIPLNETKATAVDKEFKEDLSEDKIFSSVDKKLVVFKVQLGPLKKPSQTAAMDEKVLIISDVEKQVSASGSVRYTAGSFSSAADAENYRKELEENGFFDAFVIATFRNEIISLQEAADLLKN